MGSNTEQVKPETVKLVCVASPLSTRHLGKGTKTDLLGIWTMCLSGTSFIHMFLVSVSLLYKLCHVTTTVLPIA